METKTVARFLFGFIIGSVIFGLILLALIFFAGVNFKLNSEPINDMMLMSYFVFVPLALMEEIGFRAYPFVRLNRASNLIIAQIIVAIAFGFYHIANGWTFQAAFIGTFVWAWVFGLGAAWSGGIALPTGLHVALNVLQALTGLKPGNSSIWIVSFDDTNQKTVLSGADHVGLIMQLLIFVTTVILSIVYSKKAKNH